MDTIKDFEQFHRPQTPTSKLDSIANVHPTDVKTEEEQKAEENPEELIDDPGAQEVTEVEQETNENHILKFDTFNTEKTH